MTKVIKHFTNNDAEFWYQTNPANGSHNIVVTMKGSTSVVVGAYSFFGVNQTNPIPTTATNFNTVASSPTISITTANSNSWVLDSAAIYGGKTLSSPTCTQRWNTNILNRSEEHTSELQSRQYLVCRPPLSPFFPYTTLFRSLLLWSQSDKSNTHYCH